MPGSRLVAESVLDTRGHPSAEVREGGEVVNSCQTSISIEVDFSQVICAALVQGIGSVGTRCQALLSNDMGHAVLIISRFNDEQRSLEVLHIIREVHASVLAACGCDAVIQGQADLTVHQVEQSS